MLFTLFPRLLRGVVAAALIVLCTAHVQARQYESNGYSFTTEPLPAWIDWTDLPEKSSKRPGLAIAYRLVDRQVDISENGETRFTRLVTQPLTEAGLNQAAEIQVTFNPAYQVLVLHKLNLVRDGSSTDKLDPGQVRLIQREEGFENSLYDGIVTAVIIVNDVRLKDQVDLSYSIEGRNPVFGNKHSSAFALGWDIPVDLARIRVSAPAKRKLYTRAFNIKLKPVTRRNGDRIEYEWSQLDTPAVLTEDGSPSWHQPYPGIQISEYRRWRDVSAWANNLYTSENALPPELTETLQQWRNEALDDKQLTARALKLVQDKVRYFGVELGQNSHRPSLPADVYTRRYGDCKDKAVLLVTILDQLGIQAYPALVSTEYQRDIDNWLPSPGLFDHVIVTTQLDGKRYWLDGTVNYQQGSIDTLSMPDFERALIIRPGEKHLTKIEIMDSTISTMDTIEEFRITDYDAPVKMDITTTYTGAVAEEMRADFATNTPAEISRSYMNYYAKMYPSISVDRIVESRDAPGENRFTILEHYSLENFWEDDDEGQTAYLVGSTIAPYIEKPDTLRRTSPLAISHPVNIRHQSTIIYPEDIEYRVDEPLTTIEGRFINYARTISYADRRLTITHTFNSRKDAVTPSQLDDYFKTIAKVKMALEYNSLLSEAPRKTGIRSRISTLLQRLDTLSSN